MSAGIKYTDPCDHKTILDAYRKEMDEIEKLAPDYIEDIGDVKGYIMKVQEEARTKPLWIADILSTLQEAGTDEASFEMVERLTEELIEKEEKLIAMEKTIKDMEKDKALHLRREIRYGLQKDRYKDMVYNAEDVDAGDQIGNQEGWDDQIYNDDQFEILMAEHITAFDNHKELLSKMPVDEDFPQDYWKKELMCDLCSSVWETFHLEVSAMTTEECIEEFNIDTEAEDGLYQQAYQVARGMGGSDRKAKNYDIREVIREADGGACYSLFLEMEFRDILFHYRNIYGDTDYFLVFV